MESQFLETALLNMINFQTMIATKANRVVNAAKTARVSDFGLRRAQDEDAAMKGARAAYIAGATATSNVKAGKEYGIPINGTHAHSFVMSFNDELNAFRAYAKTFPNKPTLLIDTYDTEQGARNAAIVGKELAKQGKQLGAVRIDSGNLCEMSKKVREILDAEGLNYVKIVASNDLNEYKIADLFANGARFDAFGVGTEMITAKPVAAIPGVYKIVEDNAGAKIKLSAEKKTYPGKKQIFRVSDADGNYLHDILALENENVSNTSGTPLLECVIKNGKRVSPRRNLNEIRSYCLAEVAKMPEQSKQLKATPYEMKISRGLNQLVDNLTKQYGGKK
jgi:nicotinate phosphoribosyltransferase